ncbi:SAM-dependent methyltransferase [Kineosporia sp. J2-2]|uniref:SAM-dependent methyltransferase n=1 Tax=Kineosporia corallincola TaxID=2835133 RepID=A0ABS5TSD4_9ACTN|nr:SAM-dependent methyltransferase [Kineosporia corallincola]MBT0773695.1 SAM-dependent methyltransferase [Kineosporia corallincola]
MTIPQWVGDDIDLTRPSVSRVYDYYLGGFHNFASDREMAEKAIADWPDLPLIMRSNRAFLRRGVKLLIEQGVRQFLDIGSGIPTVGNVHEVAQDLDPASRIVYVDTDPVAVAHSRSLLAGNANAEVLAGDFTQPAKLLAEVEELGLLDLDRPVAVLLNALLHFVPDPLDPAGLIGTFRDWSPAGSYLLISHATHELHPPELTRAHRDLYKNNTASPMTMRSREQVAGFFAGYELLEPGIELSEHWHPDGTGSPDQAERFPIWAGVGRKP